MKGDTTGRNRAAWWTLLGVVVVLGGSYGAAYALTGDTIARSTTVAGVQVGGLTAEEARAALAEEVEQTGGRTIAIAAEGRRANLDPTDVGLQVDVDASIDQVGVGASWDPARMWDHLVGGEDYAPVVAYDQAALEERLEALGEKVGRRPQEGNVSFRRGEAVPTYPRAGVTIDTERATAVVVAAYPSDGEVVQLPVVTEDPEISTAEVNRVMKNFAARALSAPVVYSLAGKNVRLTPRQFSSALKMRPENGRLKPQVKRKALLATFRPAVRKVAPRAQNARIALVDGRPRVIAAKRGVTFEPDEVVEKFLGMVRGKGKARRVGLGEVVARPDFTTAEARALKVREVVGEFTTFFPHADYRNINIGRGAEKINGVLLKPGETFSLNETIGERTAANGFTKGFIISNGVFKEDFGGGVSQVATTAFNAAFFAGLEDVEHKPHSFYIDRYPIGREATVAWPTVDLRFRNDTRYGVLIQAWRVPSTPSSNGSMNVRLWSTKVWDIRSVTSGRYALTEPEVRRLTGEDCVPFEGYGGFQIDVDRLFYRPGSDVLDHRERMHTTYTPADTVICE